MLLFAAKGLGMRCWADTAARAVTVQSCVLRFEHVNGTLSSESLVLLNVQLWCYSGALLWEMWHF